MVPMIRGAHEHDPGDDETYTCRHPWPDVRAVSAVLVDRTAAGHTGEEEQPRRAPADQRSSSPDRTGTSCAPDRDREWPEEWHTDREGQRQKASERPGDESQEERPNRQPGSAASNTNARTNGVRWSSTASAKSAALAASSHRLRAWRPTSVTSPSAATQSRARSSSTSPRASLLISARLRGTSWRGGGAEVDRAWSRSLG